MKRFGMRRVARYGGAAGVLVAVAVAVALAAATAEATPNKPYLANVHQTLNTPGSFTFTLTNDPHASQNLGSANFTAPAGVTLAPGTVGTNVKLNGTATSNWTVGVDALGLLEFRSTTGHGLAPGDSVSADVVAPTNLSCTPNPPANNSAKWSVEAKQSNDFSGQPGNDLQLNAASDLTPLGSFVVAPIESIVTAADGPLHVPQIIVNQTKPISITALDTCGNVDKDYSGATLNKEQNFGLVNATFSALSWSNGIGSASFTPVDVEVGNQFTVNDRPTGISANSGSTDGKPTFDVVQTICAKAGTICVWQDPKKPITATSTVPGDSNGHSSLGLGYKPFDNGVTCGAGSGVGDSIYIDPYQYTNPYTIVLVYAKSLTPKGPASSVVTCKGTDQPDGTTSWDRNAIPPCGNNPVAPCADAANIQGGALQITLHLNPGDPHTGGFSP